jgi:hypothetical protein
MTIASARKGTELKRLALVVPIFVVAAALVLAQSQRVTVTFSPEKKTPAFSAAVDEYRAIWAAEGRRIIEGMEKISTLRFPEKSIKVQIYEGPVSRGGAARR